MTPPRKTRWKFWAGIFLLVTALAGLRVALQDPERPSVPRANAADEGVTPPAAGVPVTVIHPRKGAMDRVTTQPGSILAYKSVQLFSKVPGFLKSQTVNIGDRVTKGQEL